jgi:myosin heavy subunit
MDSDLEQDYISIVQTMREQIAVLKAKLTVQQGRANEEDWERSHSKEAARLMRELRQLREEEQELRRDLQAYGEVGAGEEAHLQEVQRLSEELALAKAAFEEMAGNAQSQHHSPTNSRLSYANKKLGSLTAENIDLSQRLTLLEAERKSASERFTAVVTKVRSEDKLKMRIRQLEQVATAKDMEIRELETANTAASSSQIEQIHSETAALSLQLQQLQAKADQLEAAETAALESTTVAQKLKNELKQLDVTLQSKRKLLKIKEEELISFQAQYQRLKAELDLVNEEHTAYQLSLMGSPQASDRGREAPIAASLNHTPKGVKASFRIGPAPQTKSAGRIAAKPSVQTAMPLFGSYARLHASRSRDNRG